MQVCLQYAIHYDDDGDDVDGDDDDDDVVSDSDDMMGMINASPLGHYKD